MAKKLDPKLRVAGEIIPLTKEQMEAYVRGSEDIVYFAETFCSIQSNISKLDKDGEKIEEPLRLIQLFPWQKRALYDMQHNKRFVLMVGRQQGKTILAAIWITWFAIYNEHKEALILSFRLRSALDVMRRIQRMIINLPRWLQKGVLKEGGWANSKIEFEDEMRITASPTTDDSARGESLSLIYRDEDAIVPPRMADAIDASTLPSLESDPDARIGFTSTPRGMNHFAKRWFAAKNGTSGYKAIRAFWWEHPGREGEAGLEFKKRFIAQTSDGMKKWKSEYECSFIGSAATLVNSETLDRLHPQEPARLLYDDCLKIYEEFVPGAKYIMGVDTAMGTGGDYSAFTVLRVDSPVDIKQVAAYSCNTVKPENYALVCMAVSKMYGECMMMVENNPAGCGNEVAELLWFKIEYYRIVKTDKKRIGTFTTHEVKTAMNIMIDGWLTNGYLALTDSLTIEQLSYYESKGGMRYSAAPGQHDDSVTALGMALYWFRTAWCDFDMSSFWDEETQLKMKLAREFSEAG
jgi:hypothetical protein